MWWEVQKCQKTKKILIGTLISLFLITGDVSSGLHSRFLPYRHLVVPESEFIDVDGGVEIILIIPLSAEYEVPLRRLGRVALIATPNAFLPQNPVVIHGEAVTIPVIDDRHVEPATRGRASLCRVHTVV